MKCSLIRDLLPLYVENDCSEMTNQMVKEHLESCSDCRELYELMKSPIDVKGMDPIVATDAPNNNNQFWKKYYGRVILKGAGLFFGVYITIVTLMILLK
ncbi:zf-HC2 domain-containing protein [Halalkalibacter okhensis]|uniref:Putative zinc-finger domain-containing protein n=1 Tax=Halalkalibacter okhensis TaxID=333138 RepID=A0A0B0IED8_9BACI|nr:zf-HC2 domain-containing protein [Halalkalibacter okhensis]KHF39242.1 hypothetical protein LQ50_16170 [Halalkalibacter okhensis]